MPLAKEPTPSGITIHPASAVSLAASAQPRPAARAAILLALASFSIALTSCRSHDFADYPANYREYVYVTNGGSSTVTAISVVDVRVDREISVGQNPVALAVSPTRNEVYAVSSGATGGNGSLAIIDAEHNTVAATIPLHRQPVSIDVDAGGNKAYIANLGSNFVSVVDLKTRREVALMGAGEQPDAARITADGKTLVVANRGAGSVSLIDPATGRVRSVFPGCPGAADPAIMPDSSKAFIPCAEGHQVMVVALARNNRPDMLLTLLDVGRLPAHVALKPDTGEFFVANSGSNSISEIITGTNDVSSTYLMGDTPVRSLVSADNALLYVANLRSQNVTVYSIDDGRRIGAIHVGDGPSALAFSANGLLLFAVDSRSGDVAVARTASRALFTLIPVGRSPNAIAGKSFTIQ